MFGLISQAVKRGSSRQPRPSRFNFSAAGPIAVEYSLLFVFITGAIIAALSLVHPALLPGFQAATSGS